MTRRRPVDLARVRGALADLDAALEAHPDTRPFPPGALASDRALSRLGTLEDPPVTPLKVQLNVRIPADLAERLDAVIPILEAAPLLRAAGIRPSRSTVLRMALEKGLPVLEAELRALAGGADHGPR